jgi:hypothetical protein
VTEARLLAGANAMAIGDGTLQNWEILQFRDATLIAPNTYALAGRLRGQLGTDGTMPANWPVGSQVVMLDDQVQQMNIPAALRNVALTLRVGSLFRGPDDASARTINVVPSGIGLRPYRVGHLTSVVLQNGSVTVGWQRRSRLDGDTWSSFEVPLAEDQELYQVEVWQGALRHHQAFVTVPSWTYSTSQQAVDGVAGAFEVRVAQVSQAFGPGPFNSVTVG